MVTRAASDRKVFFKTEVRWDVHDLTVNCTQALETMRGTKNTCREDNSHMLLCSIFYGAF